MRRGSLSGLLAGLLSLAVATTCLAANPPVTVAGKVLDARDGTPVAKAEVIVRGQVASSGPNGDFSTAKIPTSAPIAFRVYRLLPPTEGVKEERYEFMDQTVETPLALIWVNAEVEVRQENQVRKVPAYGWVVADLAKNTPAEVRVAIRDDEGEFCMECHAENGYLAKKTAKAPKPWPVIVDVPFFTSHRFRDMHPSQVPYPTNPEIVKKRKYAPREEVAGMLLDGERMTCLTCHTPHRPNPNGGFAVLEYERTGQLCRRCHR
jgi:predicted CXXCH cytochrome family protein